MTIRALVSEALRNLRSGTVRWWTTVPAFSILVFAVVGVTVQSQTRVLDEIRERRVVGANALVVTAAGRVNGERCQSLNGLPRVVAAGAYTDSAQLRLRREPGSPIPIRQGTLGYLRLIGGSTPQAGGLVVSDSILAELDETVGGSVVAVDGSRIPIVGRIDASDKDSNLTRVAISVAPSGGAFNSCVVDFWPPTTSDSALVLTTVDGSGTTDVETRQLNSSLGPARDPARQLAASSEPSNLWIVVGVGFLVGLSSVLTRRSELSLSRQMGFTRSALVAQTAFETVGWLSAALAIVAPAVAHLVTAGRTRKEAEYLVELAMRLAGSAGLAALLGAAAGAAVIRRADVLRHLRER